MDRLKFLIVSLFVVALGTGVVVGMGLSHNASTADNKPTPGGTHNGPPSLTEALSLTPAQSDQLKSIWTDWDPTRQSRFDRWHQYQKERDDSVQALLTDSQKAAFDDIQKKYHQQLDQIDEDRKQAFQAAVDKTKAILTDSQRAKYDEILKNGPPSRSGRGGEHGGDHGHGGPSTHHGPGTQPASLPVQQL